MVALLAGTQITTDNGLTTQYGIVLPPGAQVVAYVRSTGVQSQDTAFIATNLVPTLAQGLARARPGLGDFVICLPGHVENVIDGTTFSGSLQAGTKIIGVGRGTNTPTFTFLLAGAQWLVNKADVSIAGLRFSIGGINLATAAISVTASDFGFFSNDCEVNTGLGQFLNFITVSGAANRADISSNIIRGTQSGGTTSAIITISTTGQDCRVCDNEMNCAAVTATGMINVTTATKSLNILRNTLFNSSAASVACIGFSNVISTGNCANNTCTVLNTGAQVSGTTGIAIGAASLVGFFNNLIVNDPLKSGILQPVADT